MGRRDFDVSRYYSRGCVKMGGPINFLGKISAQVLTCQRDRQNLPELFPIFGISESLDVFISLCAELTYEESENSTSGKNSETAEKPL